MLAEFQVFLDKVCNIFFQVDGLRKVCQILYVVIVSACLVFPKQALHAALCPGESLLQLPLYLETSGFSLPLFHEIPVRFVKPGYDHRYDVVCLVEIGWVDDTYALKPMFLEGCIFTDYTQFLRRQKLRNGRHAGCFARSPFSHEGNDIVGRLFLRNIMI